MIMHLRPELIDPHEVRHAGELVSDQIRGFFVSRDMRQRTKEGCTGRPDLATAEKGEQMFVRILAELSAALAEIQQQPLGQTHNHFLA